VRIIFSVILVLFLVFTSFTSFAVVNDDLIKLTATAIKDDTNIEQIKELIDKGADINVKDKNGWTPLRNVAFIGRSATAKLLIDKGADVNASDLKGNSILMSTAAMPFPEQANILKMLLQKGADVNARNNEGWTALMQAARGHSAAIIQEAVRVGKEDAAQSFESIPFEMASLLIKNGADVNARDIRGITALMQAASEGHNRTVKLLIESGADVNAQGPTGLTPLMLAIPGKTEAMKLLINGGADVNRATTAGRTALISAARSGDADAVKLLLDKGADIRVKDSWGRNAATYAGMGGQGDILRLLQSAGAKEAFDLSKKEAYVFGKILFIEEGKEFEPHGRLAGADKGVVTFNMETGQLVNWMKIKGGFFDAFKQSIDGDGVFCWKFPRGTYMIDRFIWQSTRDTIYPQLVFQVPYGMDAIYFGTVKITLKTRKSFPGTRYIDEMVSIKIEDDLDAAKEIIKRRNPDFSGTIEKILMIHDQHIPINVKDQQKETVSRILNSLVLPLLQIK
jgi:ankyrin repeat protein